MPLAPAALLLVVVLCLVPRRWPAGSAEWIRGALALALLAAIVVGLAWWRRRLRIRIGAAGLDIRTRPLRRSLTWAEVDAVVLAYVPTRGRTQATPQLLLVPATGVDLGVPLDERSPVDGRPAARLVDLGIVAEDAEFVAAALTRFAETRFTDARPDGRTELPEFTVVLRGYDRPQVDELVSQAESALRRGSAPDRAAARERLRAAEIPVVVRGYDRLQVDDFLARLAAELAAS